MLPSEIGPVVIIVANHTRPQATAEGDSQIAALLAGAEELSSAAAALLLSSRLLSATFRELISIATSTAVSTLPELPRPSPIDLGKALDQLGMHFPGSSISYLRRNPYQPRVMPAPVAEEAEQRPQEEVQERASIADAPMTGEPEDTVP